MANTNFKVESGMLVTGANSTFVTPTTFKSNTTIDANLLLVNGDFTVTGNLTVVGSTIQDVDIIPLGERNIGNNTNRFDAYLNDVNINGTLYPSANNIPLGNTTRRWDTYSSNISATGTVTVTNAVSFGNTSIGGFANVVGVFAAGNTTITGFVNVSTTANVGGNLTVGGTATLTGNVTTSGNLTSKGIILDNAAIFANTQSVTTTSPTIVDSYPKSFGFFSKAVVTVNAGNTLLHAVELLILQDGTNVILTKYGEIYNTNLGTFDANINGANVDISFTATTANTYTVKTIRQQIRA